MDASQRVLGLESPNRMATELNQFLSFVSPCKCIYNELEQSTLPRAPYRAPRILEYFPLEANNMSFP
jgi:hypothetical protein